MWQFGNECNVVPFSFSSGGFNMFKNTKFTKRRIDSFQEAFTVFLYKNILSNLHNAKYSTRHYTCGIRLV